MSAITQKVTHKRAGGMEDVDELVAEPGITISLNHDSHDSHDSHAPF